MTSVCLVLMHSCAKRHFALHPVWTFHFYLSPLSIQTHLQLLSHLKSNPLLHLPLTLSSVHKVTALKECGFKRKGLFFFPNPDHFSNPVYSKTWQTFAFKQSVCMKNGKQPFKQNLLIQHHHRCLSFTICNSTWCNTGTWSFLHYSVSRLFYFTFCKSTVRHSSED